MSASTMKMSSLACHTKTVKEGYAVLAFDMPVFILTLNRLSMFREGQSDVGSHWDMFTTWTSHFVFS